MTGNRLPPVELPPRQRRQSLADSQRFMIGMVMAPVVTTSDVGLPEIVP